MRRSAAFTAFLAILTIPVLAISAPVTQPTTDTFTMSPRAETPGCDNTCMRRFIYETAFSSGAAGVGQVMQTFDSTSWCLSDENKDWCPGTIDSTVSGLVSGTLARTTLPEESNVVAVVKTLAGVSQKAALSSMSWAFTAVNGSDDGATTGNREVVQRVRSIIYHLSNDRSFKVNTQALQVALNSFTPSQDVAHTPGANDNDDDDKKQGLILGTTVPAAVLGPFLGSGAGFACPDPILCAKGPAQYVSRLLKSMTAKDVLRPDHWLRHLVSSANGNSGEAPINPPTSPVDPPLSPVDPPSSPGNPPPPPGSDSVPT